MPPGPREHDSARPGLLAPACGLGIAMASVTFLSALTAGCWAIRTRFWARVRSWGVTPISWVTLGWCRRHFCRASCGRMGAFAPDSPRGRPTMGLPGLPFSGPSALTHDRPAVLINFTRLMPASWVSSWEVRYCWRYSLSFNSTWNLDTYLGSSLVVCFPLALHRV